MAAAHGGDTKINYRPRNANFERTTTSVIEVWLTPGDVQAVPELLSAAEQARTQAGYSDRNRRQAGNVNGDDFWILCAVHPFYSASQDTPSATQNPLDETPIAAQIQLEAPYLEP